MSSCHGSCCAQRWSTTRKAALQVLKEKAVKRNIPLKALAEGEIHPAAKGHVRQAITVMTGISALRKACSATTRRFDSPFARAVRM